jgi:hypothetical protein
MKKGAPKNGSKTVSLNKDQFYDIFRVYDAMRALNNWAIASGSTHSRYEDAIKEFMFETLRSLQSKNGNTK